MRKREKRLSWGRLAKRCGTLFFAVAVVMIVAEVIPPETVKASETGSQETHGKALVDDKADLLTPEAENEVQTRLRELAGVSGWTCFALTTADTGGKTAREYADDYVDQNAFEEDGVCFLIDMDNREIYLCTTGEAIRYLTDNRIEEVLDQGYPYVSSGDYGNCFTAMIESTQEMYGRGIYADQYNREEHVPGLKGPEILLAFAAALAASGILVLLVVRKYRVSINTYRYDFHSNSQVDLRVREDRFINQFVTRRTIPKANSGHGSSTHSSAGGGTHGGGGRSF